MTTIEQPQIADGTILHWGDQSFTFGKDAFELEDSTQLMHAGDFEGLRLKMAETGATVLQVPRMRVYPSFAK